MQAALKREAAALSVEEQLKDKEAIEAENAAAHAKIAENEAQVRCGSIKKCMGLSIMHRSVTCRVEQ